MPKIYDFKITGTSIDTSKEKAWRGKELNTTIHATVTIKRWFRKPQIHAVFKEGTSALWRFLHGGHIAPLAVFDLYEAYKAKKLHETITLTNE